MVSRHNRDESATLEAGFQEKHDHKGAAMIFGLEARLRKSAAPLRMGFSYACVLGISVLAVGSLSGCKNFWAAPTGSTEITLTNGGNIAVTAGASGTSAITVTPENSWTGTVTLTCAVTDSITSDVSPATCSLSPTSVSISNSTAGTSTLTATTTATTTAGAYTVTVTGTTTDGTTATTPVCVAVGSGTCTSSASGTSGFFYILNSTSISGYSISAGTLNTLANSTYTLSGGSAMAMSPSGNFLYVASANGITLYTINSSTGALGQGSTPVFDDPLAEAIQVDPSGKWLVDASGAGTLNAYPITSSGTEDTSRSIQSPQLASASVEPGGIAISPNGALIAVALGSKGTEAFPFAAGNSSPVGSPYSNLLTPYGSAGSAIAVAIDPQNRLLYVGETAAFPSSTTNFNTGALRVYTISANSLTPLTTTPYAPAGTGPHAILPDSTGAYVFAASWQSGSAGVITGYSVTPTALTALSSTTATGTSPSGLAEDSTGNYVLGVSSSGPTIDAYTFSDASGQLASPVTSSIVSSPIAIVAVPQ
jgi:6-phosphogluconolactonase (cycloisomerase 2 family)